MEHCSCGCCHKEEKKESNRGLYRLLVAGGLFLAGLVLPWGLPCFIVAYLAAGGDILWNAAKNIVRGRIFDEHFLMSLASLGAFALGEYPEAVAVMLFYQVGEYFQDKAVDRSRRSIEALLKIRPDRATVLREQALEVAAEEVAVGEVILVRPGERIPLDGIVLEGSANLDTAALTGESMPRQVCPEMEVLSGSIDLDGTLAITVTKAFGESTASKIIELTENAAAKKAPAEKFITKFAKIYTPVVVILAALVAFVPPLFVGELLEWVRRGIVFLVVSCPCALVVSVPLTYFGGIGACSRRGILVKGSNYLDALTKIDTLVFDKTGTLTEGKFGVTGIFAAEGFTEQEVLTLAARAEQYSNHPIARSILQAYGGEPEKLAEQREVAGLGVVAGDILVGNRKWMEENHIACTPGEGTVVYVAVAGRFAGYLTIADRVKKDSKSAISHLKKLGVSNIMMLTGDSEAVAAQVAEELGLDGYFAQLLPQEKLEKLENIPGNTLFAGDGINDAPCLARADVGVAMGGLGSDAAIAAADVVLMTDEPGKIGQAITLARKTRAIVVQNIGFALGVKVLIMVLGALGFAGMWAAVFADVGVAFLAVLNAMRMLKK